MEIDDEIDPELQELINLLNKVPGIDTFDSCFGHPGRTCNHQPEAFIGMNDWDDSDSFQYFWETFYDKHYGKLYTKDGSGWFQISVVFYPFGKCTFYRLHINPEHDPGFDERGKKEKLEGIEFLCNYIKEWMNKK